MSSLSPRLQVRVQQKQTLTPGLVQMVSLLQLNRLELKDMISAEIAQNPVLEEATEGGEELTPEELQPLLEADAERSGEPADQSILEATAGPAEADADGADYAGARNFDQRRRRGCRPRTRRRSFRRSRGGNRRNARKPPRPSRSVRRDRPRRLFRQLPGPGLQEPRFGKRRKTFLRDLPVLARHPLRSPSFPARAGRHE